MDLIEKKDKVFISYTIRDNSIDKNFLIQLNTFLNSSFIVFIDYLHNDSDGKQERIEREVVNSDFLILIKTEQTFSSEWVLREIDIAMRFNIPIFEFEFDELINKKFLPITSAHKQWRHG